MAPYRVVVFVNSHAFGLDQVFAFPLDVLVMQAEQYFELLGSAQSVDAMRGRDDGSFAHDCAAAANASKKV